MEPTFGLLGFITARIPDGQVQAYCKSQLSSTPALVSWLLGCTESAEIEKMEMKLRPALVALLMLSITLLALLSAGGGVSAVSPSATPTAILASEIVPVPGTWSGTIDQGHSLSLIVRADSLAVTQITLWVDITCTGGSTTIMGAVGSNWPIANNQVDIYISEYVLVSLDKAAALWYTPDHE